MEQTLEDAEVLQGSATRSGSRRRRGPKTAAGKAQVALNALTHGLTSARLVVLGESQTDWQTYRRTVVEALAPVGPVEAALAERVASALWRLRRVRVRGGVDRGAAGPGDGQRPLAAASPRHRQDYSVRSAPHPATLPGSARARVDAGPAARSADAAPPGGRSQRAGDARRSRSVDRLRPRDVGGGA